MRYDCHGDRAECTECCEVAMEKECSLEVVFDGECVLHEHQLTRGIEIL